MIRATMKVKTVKKLINLPDDLVNRIDILANGYYPTRSDFLSHATISFIRNRMNCNRLNLVTYQNDYKDLDLVEKIFEESELGLRELKKELLPKYVSREVTPITLYITEKQFETILICFITDYGELRNLQEFVRLAAAYYVRELEQEYEILDLMDPERFKGVYEIDKTT
jgi:hypothetical protein